MTSLHDLLAQLNRAKQDLIELDARIAARRQELDEMAGRFNELGVVGTTAQLHAAQGELDNAHQVRAQLATSLETATELTITAIGNTGGVATLGSTEDAADYKPATPTPSGEELLEESDKPRSSFVSRLSRKVTEADGTDPVKNLTESANNISQFFQNDLDPGHAGTTAEVQVPTNTEVLRPQAQKAGPGDAAIAVVAVALVAAKGTQKLNTAMRKWTGNTKERSDDDKRR